jgi:outer membrane protein assembly factor BamB
MTARNEDVVFIGIKGTVLALDRRTGGNLWTTHLKGGDFVNLVLDGRDLLATTKGEVFCVDPSSGQIKWNNPLRGLGWGLATIATADSSSTAAMAEHRRREQSSDAAATTTAATAAAG